jgi:organic hydroperoxide reductase OsmC/OhrA
VAVRARPSIRADIIRARAGSPRVAAMAAMSGSVRMVRRRPKHSNDYPPTMDSRKASRRPCTPKHHRYAVRTVWEDADGIGTRSYDGYSRDHRFEMVGKPVLHASADPAFCGDRAKANPEDLFLAAVSSCHMLFFLALCARNGVCVLAYEDAAEATLELHADGGGAFSNITLRPCVTVSRENEIPLARTLHDRAGELCFIARSCAAPIEHIATIRS